MHVIAIYLCNNGIRFAKGFYPSVLYFSTPLLFEENLLHFGSCGYSFMLKDTTMAETLPKCSKFSSKLQHNQVCSAITYL